VKTSPTGERGTRDWVRWIASLGASAVLLVAASAIAPRVTLDPVVAYAIGFAMVVASALASALCCPRLDKRALWFSALACVPLGWLTMHRPPEIAAAVVVTLALLVAGTTIGNAIGSAIEHPGHLVFVAIVSAAADVASVFHPSGPSSAIAQSKAALSVLALPWPMLGTDRLEPFLGVGDVVFTALYLASTRRHALALWRSLLGLTLGYAVTMVTVVALEVAVPALPFLGLGVVLAQPSARRPPRQDRMRGYTLAALVVCVVAVLLLRR
jgi:hypothetical protein